MENRTRANSWQNPNQSLKDSIALSGLEYLAKTFECEIAPLLCSLWQALSRFL